MVDAANSDNSDTTPSTDNSSNDLSNATLSDTATDADLLGFKPYVAAIATFLTDADTKPPLTLSIEGEWGSGKSSFMKQLQKEIFDDAQGRAKPKIVWFNAWRQEQHEALWAAFALKFLEEISKGSILYKVTTWFKLIRRRANWRQWPDIIRILCLDLFFIVIIGSLPVVFIASWRGGLVSEIANKITCYLSPAPSSASTQSSTTTPSCESSAINRLLHHLLLLGGAGGSTAGVFSLITTILKSPIHDPKYDLKAYLDSPDYEKRVAFIEQFHQDFDNIVKVYAGKDRTGAPNKIYVFIDDIDRCELTKAAELMQAVYLMTADNPHIIFILGMDREKLAASIALRQKDILPYLQSSSGNGGDGLDYGYTFIEKFVQLPFQVPIPSSSEDQDSKKLDEFFDTLLSDNQESVTTESKKSKKLKWPEWIKPSIILRIREVLFKPGENSKSIPSRDDNDSSPRSGESSQAGNEGSLDQSYLKSLVKSKLDAAKLKEIGKMVAPALDNNPRRLKLFINLIKLRAHIFWNTGFTPETSEEDPDSQTLTLEQLGKFTAITLKWPLLLADLEREKELLADLQRLAINGAANNQTKIIESRPLLDKWKEEQKLIDLLKVGCLEGDQDNDPDRYSLEEFDIRKLLEVSPRLVRSAEDDLSSEKGIDYRKLQQLLQEENWEAADEETYEVMIRAVGKRSGDWFTNNELLNFPCKDLLTIDGLWVRHSQGHFGFSVQKEIYMACGARLDGEYPGDEIWREFCDRIGWRTNEQYISISEVIFDGAANRGHLPFRAPSSGFRKFDRNNTGALYLFSRIETCKL